MINIRYHVVHSKFRSRVGDSVAAIGLLLGVGIAMAAPGALDQAFSDYGLLSLPIGNYGASADGIVQQTDGRLVLAGHATVRLEDDGDFIAVRLMEDGSLDDSFGADGIASADFSGFFDRALAVTQQTDGKLVLAGSAGATGGEDIALARFNADGTLDAAFGNGGRVTLDVGGSGDVASSVIEQSGGKLIVTGASNAGGTYRSVFARFNTNGTLDSTFGTDGTTLVDFGSGFESRAQDIAQQSDGRLVAVGQVFDSDSMDMGIMRVTANGMLDSSLDGDGILAVDFNGRAESAMSVVIQPDGAIVAAGSTALPDGSGLSAVLLRLNSDGSADDGFGAAGQYVAELGGAALLNSVVLLSDGRLVAAGTRFIGEAGQDMILARFNSNGALDATFGIDGVATADFGIQGEAVLSAGTALIQQVDGKYVAVGPNSLGTFGVARFDDNAEFAGRIGLTSTMQFVAETDSSVTYLVRRTGGRSGEVTVKYATAAGEAQQGSDFQEAYGILTWRDGDASDKALTIDVIDDAEVEGGESFSLVLSAPTGGARLAASEASTTIGSDDGPGQLGFADFFGQFYGVTEEGYVSSARVFRINGAQGAVSVSYRTNSCTATAGTDFVATSGTLNWRDGDMDVKEIEVQTLEDSVAEGVERFEIQLTNPTGGATFVQIFGGANDHWIMTIGDNDGPTGQGGSDGCGGGGGGGGGGGDGGGGGGGSGSAGNGGSGALDWPVLLFLICLAFQSWCPASATAVQSR